jgi:hypothetical protein
MGIIERRSDLDPERCDLLGVNRFCRIVSSKDVPR